MKRLITVSLVVVLGALAACSTPSAPSAKQVPDKAGYSRYMLASGATASPGCVDNGNGTQTCEPGVTP